MKRRRDADAATSLTRSEEELALDVESRDVGGVRARKRTENSAVERTVDRTVERADTERAPALDADTGEIITYDDGSVSIPVYEEELVIEKRLVVKERVIVRKHTVTEQYRVEADLLRERVEVDADPQIADRVHTDGDASEGPDASRGPDVNQT